MSTLDGYRDRKLLEALFSPQQRFYEYSVSLVHFRWTSDCSCCIVVCLLGK